MDFKNTNWKEGNLSLLNYLKSIEDIKYREFTRKLTPGDFDIIGVRIPTLRKIAKSISNGDYRTFLKTDHRDIYELKMIRGFVIGNIKDIEEYREAFHAFVPLVDNWAVCDTFIAGSKIIIKDRPYFFAICQTLLSDRDEFKNRISFVILLTYFVNEEYIEKVLELIKGYRSECYYANMALAWVLSVIYVKFPTKAKTVLKENSFDEKVMNYTIRKIKDSYRVSREDKEWLKNVN